MTTNVPSVAELEETVARQRQLIEELEERVAYLEQRVANGHECTVDLCSLDGDGRCRLAPRAEEES